MDYLILRCHPRETLPLSILNPDLYVPTTIATIRKGPSRTRHKVPIPILPSFIFAPLDSPKLPSLLQTNPQLHIMKRPPPLSFAYCTRHEIDIMVSTHHILSNPPPTFSLGTLVIVKAGLLKNVIGTITQIRNNGDIRLKIQQHLGWKFNTCIVNVSVLQSLPITSPR